MKGDTIGDLTGMRGYRQIDMPLGHLPHSLGLVTGAPIIR